jgi:hypothetical protein
VCGVVFSYSIVDHGRSDHFLQTRLSHPESLQEQLNEYRKKKAIEPAPQKPQQVVEHSSSTTQPTKQQTSSTAPSHPVQVDNVGTLKPQSRSLRYVEAVARL